jgi:hypothetical protein
LGAKTTEHLKEIPINIISIHKARQIIQNKEGKYLPDENIQKVRKQRDKEFKAYLQKIKN